MKICANCGKQLSDDADFCVNCGTSCAAAPQAQQNYANGYQPDYISYDHTSEFDSRDISYNKVFCIAVYLMGILGIIIAMLASHDSAYVSFHVRQSLKISIVEILIVLCSSVLFWTLIVPLAGLVCYIVLIVVRIICFFQICNGKSVEAAIIRNLDFLK